MLHLQLNGQKPLVETTKGGCKDPAGTSDMYAKGLNHIWNKPKNSNTACSATGLFTKYYLQTITVLRSDK